jgi:RNA polymerase sigma factor (TIGR02999 family)
MKGEDVPQTGEISRILAAVRDGDREAFGAIFPLVYNELRQMARHRMRAERPGHTLSPTALVHEAYLKLAGLERIEWRNRAQFFALAAQAMRQVLVDHALRRKAHKRGGGQVHVTLDEGERGYAPPLEEILALDEALRRLEETDERRARVVVCRFFAGMEVEETAAALGTSEATVKRDWSVARAWLNRELGGRSTPSP